MVKRMYQYQNRDQWDLVTLSARNELSLTNKVRDFEKTHDCTLTELGLYINGKLQFSHITD